MMQQVWDSNSNLLLQVRGVISPSKGKKYFFEFEEPMAGFQPGSPGKRKTMNRPFYFCAISPLSKEISKASYHTPFLSLSTLQLISKVHTKLCHRPSVLAGWSDRKNSTTLSYYVRLQLWLESQAFDSQTHLNTVCHCKHNNKKLDKQDDIPTPFSKNPHSIPVVSIVIFCSQFFRILKGNFR